MISIVINGIYCTYTSSKHTPRSIITKAPTNLHIKPIGMDWHNWITVIVAIIMIAQLGYTSTGVCFTNYVWLADYMHSANQIRLTTSSECIASSNQIEKLQS